MSTSARSRWLSLPLAVRAAALLAAVAIAAVVAVRAFDASLQGTGTDGERSSSFTTTDDGTAAYAELLARFDHRVERSRAPLTGAGLDPRDTLVVLDPGSLGNDDAAALLAFVGAGGRLVIGGDEAASYLPMLRDSPPQPALSGPTVYDDVDARELGGVRAVRAGRGHSFVDTGSATPLVSSGRDVLLAKESLGRGEMLFLADPSVLHNALLAEDDNAAFGVALVGTPRRVVFSEAVHGYGASGLGAIPRRWQHALALLGGAAIVATWARGRRLGPPEDADRGLPPARREYVDALAATLQRAGTPDAPGERIRGAVRARLAARAGLTGELDDATLERHARRAGMTEEEVRAVVAGVRDDAGLLAAGRALARVQGWDGDEEGDR